MKTKIFLTLSLMLAVTIMFAQEKGYESIPLIGDEAPAFRAESSNGTINFPDDYGNSWKILFGHPLDFTPVCTSELLELAYMQSEFKELGVELAVVSTDNLESHQNWKKSMESLSYKSHEPVSINYPLIDDASIKIAKKYGMIHPSNHTTEYVRGVFIIDPENKVRAISFSPMEVGRNIDDIKRTIVALQTADNSHVYTPANWEQGDDVILPYLKPGDEGSSLVAKQDDPDVYQVSWYLTMKKAK